jgi:site-specific recombinase XerD
MNTLIISSPLPLHAQIITDHPRLSDRTKAQYIRAVDNLIKAGIDPRNADRLAAHAASLPHSERAFLKAALRILFADTITRLQSSASPENLAQVQAMLLNIEAMNKTIQVKKHKGLKAHIWLSKQQIDQITARPDMTTTRGMRDYIILATLLGAGLRREEMSELTFDCLKRLPFKGEMADALEVKGKGDVYRVVPISPILAGHLREWRAIVGGGRVARSIHKTGSIGESLSTVGIHDIVSEYGASIDLPALDPHDCRRSFGRLIYDHTLDILLVRDLLGHADVKTTQEYIGLRVRLDSAPSDYILRPEPFKFMEVSGD